MPVTLNTFASIANVAKDDQSIFVKRDTVKAGTSLHRASTFRATTAQFLEALTNEYGTHLGEVATELLKHDMEAGKPLKAAQVKEFIALGRQHAAQRSLDAIRTDRQAMEGVLRNMYGDAELTLTDSQYGSLRQVFGRLQSTVVASAHLHEDHAYDDLADQLSQNKMPLVRTAADLILGRSDSELVRLGYPREQDPQLLQDKLKVLTLIAPLDSPRVDSGIVFKCMVALEDIRQAKPAPAELNGADFFAALFPEELTPTLKRPSLEVVAQYTPRQLQELFKRAADDYLDNFKVGQLPPNSIFRGKDSGETTLMMAKALNIMPQQLLHAPEDRVTLKDFPLLQGDNYIDSGYKTLQEAQTSVCKDMPRLGTGLNDTAEPPVISFTLKNGETTRETVGAQKFPAGEQSADAELYLNARPSTVSARLFASLHGLAKTPAQEKALTGALTQMGVMPLKHMIQCFGEYMTITEHSKFDYVFQQNEDDSVDVTITTGEELKGFNGAGRLTYHVEPDGRSGITDFQWDRPTVEERKDAILNSTAYPTSYATALDRAAEAFKEQLGPEGQKQFKNLAHRLMADSMAGAMTHDQLPSLTEQQNMVKFNLPTAKRFGSKPTFINQVIDFCQSPRAILRNLKLTEPQRAIFSEAVVTMDLSSDDLGMDELLAHLDQLAEARKSGPLTRETIWNVLYDEPFPPNEAHRECRILMTFRRGDKLVERCRQEAARRFEDVHEQREFSEQLYATLNGLIFSGVSMDLAWDIANGHGQQEMTLADLSETCGFIFTKSFRDVDMALADLSKDLFRIGDQHITDNRGKLPASTTPGQISISLPQAPGQPDQSFEFQPKSPEGLDEQNRRNYELGRPDNAISQRLRSMIVDYCGEDHPEQATAALLALGQGGQSFTRSLSSAFDMAIAEHADVTIRLTHDANHNIHVNYENVEGSPLLYHWEFVIGPDGKQSLADFSMKRADA